MGQFEASIILVAGTIIVYRQVNYMRSQKLGANINETLAIKGAFGGLSDSAYRDVYSAFKEEILGVNGVKSITAL